MELTSLEQVRVKTFHEQHTVVEVNVGVENDKVAVSQIHKNVCLELGLVKTSWPYFVLVEGDKSCPLRVLSDADRVETPVEDLWLSKWIFDEAEEKSVLDDPTALHLITRQVKHELESLGRILYDCASHSSIPEYCSAKEMEFCSDCRKLPFYYTTMFNNCELRSQTDLIEMGSMVVLAMDSSGVYLVSGKLRYFDHWTRVKSWSYDMEQYSFCLNIQDRSGRNLTLAVTSAQISFLLSALQQHIRKGQNKYRPEALFFTSMKRHHGSWTELENALFDPSFPAQAPYGYHEL